MTRMVEYILKVFPAEYLNRNVTFTLFFFVVIAARLILVKCPKKYSYMLWSLLGIKAIFDFGFLTLSDIVERLFAKPEAASYVAGENTGFVGKTFTILGPLNLTETANEIEEAANKGFDKWYLVFGAVWALGVLLFIVMGIMSYKDLSRKVKLSFENGDVRVCDYIDSPMVFGIAKPRIYVPSGVEIDKLEYVIKHERVHLRRGDTFFKLMAFAILSFYWMNPLAWIAFKLFNLDMELSCDEAVLQKETVSVKEAYGKWLVFFASKGSVFGPVPTSFGETDVEKRVKNMKNIKAVKGGIAVVAMLIVIGATVLFLVKAPKLFKTTEKDVPTTGTEETLTTEVEETALISDEAVTDGEVIFAESYPTLKSISEQYGISEEDLTSIEFEITLPNNEKKTIPYSLTNVDQNEITINGETYKIEMVAWVWPLEENKGVITATFGERPSLMDEDGENTTKTHEEVDIAAEEGTPVLAARMGEITFAGWEEDTGCGNVVIIKADDSTEIKYSHLKSVSVKAGDTVLPGDQVGEVGNTGYSTGPHLGFQIKKDGVAIDPMTFYEQE